MTVRVYTAKHCAPCQDVRQAIKEGRHEDKVELVDIETDEGFELFKQEVLSHSDGAVPSAYQDGKQCAIGFNEEKYLVFDCPTDDSRASGKD